MDHPPPDVPAETDQGTKPFLEHLEDLRSTLIGCVVALVVGMCVSFPLAPYLLGLLKKPLQRVTDKPDEFLRTLDVTGAFMLSMQIAFWGGLILSAPVLTYFLARFIAPGLTARERELVRRSLGFAGGLFFFGVALGYFVALPVAMEVMFGMNKWMGIRAEWTITSYISFATQLLLGFGLVFEFPLVLFVLGRLGIINSGQLRRARKIVVIIILVVAAFITPGPDMFSQFIMAAPMLVLYELCIWMLRFSERSRRSA
ncbi:MAG: twin-arginine translocase subunit TatC [Kiritimatiellaeota bacterium]|nr:twin-arginine translocase subunit TatC [Kiritimatiellota bacterium]